MRTDRHTYAEAIDGPWLLYDNQADPDQLDNLVDKAERVDLQAALTRELDQWLAKTGDSFESPAWYLQRYGYQVEENGAAPCTYALEEPAEGWPPQQIAKRREALDG